MLDDTLVELEAATLDHLGAARMAAVEHGNVVLLGHRIHGVHEAEEVLLDINVLLSVCRKQDVMPGLKT